MSKAPNSEWVHRFHETFTPSNTLGYGPGNFVFRDDRASVNDPPDHIRQQVVNDFKKFLAKANATYKELLLRKARKQEEAEKKRLQQRIEEEEKRQSIRSQTRS